MTDETAAPDLAPLARALLDGSRRCLRPPVDRFRHPWIAPMPLSAASESYLRVRRGGSFAGMLARLDEPDGGDGFKLGDYSLGLFHHDASEAAIELLQHEELRESAAGSLLCLLDCAAPDGMVHRVELPHKSREAEPSKPVIAQYALRVVRALGDDGPAWAERHRVVDRVTRFVEWTERATTGMHGLLLTHSALASGFDSDLLTANQPDRTVEGPDTNALMVLEYDALAELCRQTGRPADRWEERATVHRELMEALLWVEDDDGGFYAGLRYVYGVGSLQGEVVGERGVDGRFRALESWTSLLPLYAGVPSPARAERLVARLLDPERYWGPHGVRTAPRCSPYFHQAPRILQWDPKKHGRGPVSNWTGPVWVLSNYYMAQGLSRYGHEEHARALAIRTAELLAADLAATGALHECYDDAGTGLWPRTGTFLSWNVLALALLRAHAPERLPPEARGA